MVGKERSFKALAGNLHDFLDRHTRRGEQH
jgi:hypothetical protein